MFLTGLTHLTNWFGNVIMPTLAGLLFVISVLRFSRNAPFQYSMYGGFAALMVSGLLHAIETFAKQKAWNNPDAVWFTFLGLVNWSGNVFLPLYGVLQIVMAIMHYGGVGFRIHPGAPWARHILAAGLCFGLSGFLRLAEYFVTHGGGGIS